VVPENERDLEISERAVSAEARSFSVRVTDRGWAVPPQRVLLHHTPLWVTIRNTADQVVRVDPEDWALVVAGEESAGVAPERLVATASGSLAETRLIRAQSLLAGSLQPGQAASGFVFFRRRFEGSEQGQAAALRVRVRSADGLDTLDVVQLPLRVGR